MKRTEAFEERIVDGARVWTGHEKWPIAGVSGVVLYAVTFPDSGCANFYLQSSNPNDAAIIRGIAQSFHPRIRSAPGRLCDGSR